MLERAFLLLFSLFLASSPAEPSAISWKKITPNARGLHRVYVQKQLLRLFDGKYDELEKEASSFSFSVPPESIGLSPSHLFFDSFYYRDWNDKPEWDLLFKALDGWVNAYPESPYSRLARARAFSSYAWAARGGGFAYTVTPEGWRLMRERLAAAREDLQAAQTRHGDDQPEFWSNTLRIARGLQNSSEDTLKLAQQAVGKFPEEPSLYAATCVYLLPRWHGRDGQWQKWLKEQAEGLDQKENSMPSKIYAQVIWRVLRAIYDKDGPFFQNSHLSWPKTQEGIRQLIEQYPESLYWKTVLAYVAWHAQDQKVFLQALDLMQGSFDSWAFASEDFHTALKWAGRPDTIASQ
jgi:hypothetical protein